MSDLYRLAIFEPKGSGSGQRIDLIPLSSDVTALSWSSSLPGGFNGLTVGIEHWSRRGQYEGFTRGYLAQETHVRHYAHVELWAGSALLWEGRVKKIEKHGGVIRGFAAVGYMDALSDDTYTSTSTTNVTAGTILTEVIEAHAPLIRLGEPHQFQDTLVQYRYDALSGMTPAEIVDTIAKAGDSTVTWDASVWEHQTLWLLPRYTPDVPDYHVPFDDTITEWTEDGSDLYGSAYVRYSQLSDTTGVTVATATATNPTFSSRYGVSRIKALQGGRMYSQHANAFRDTWLAEHATPVVTASMVRGPERGMERPGGAEIPGHLVRAGQWVQVGTESPLPIVSASFDGFSRTLQLSLGRPSPRNPGQLLKPLYESRVAALNKRDPLTGSQERR